MKYFDGTQNNVSFSTRTRILVKQIRKKKVQHTVSKKKRTEYVTESRVMIKLIFKILTSTNGTRTISVHLVNQKVVIYTKDIQKTSIGNSSTLSKENKDQIMFEIYYLLTTYNVLRKRRSQLY